MNEQMVGALIPQDSEEAVWSWDVPSDSFFLSRGARRELGLAVDDIPGSMTAFLAHIPPACLPMLHEVREGVLSGNGSFLEATYPFGPYLVRERMMVLARNAQGRAVTVVGCYDIAKTKIAYRPALTNIPDEPAGDRLGYWQCTFADRLVHADAVCSAILGYTDGQPHSYSLDDWKKRLHPQEGSITSCRYQLVLEEPLLGDAIEDLLHIRLETGDYARVHLRGAVLKRDSAGKALALAGTLQAAELVDTFSEASGLRENGRLLSAINATGDGLWDWDARSDKVYYSPRYLSMIGYTAEEFPGDLETWKEKIHPDDIHKIVPPQRDLVESPRFGDTFECTYRLKRKDGSWAWILGRGYVTHRDSNGRATRLVGLHTDITATQNGREQLEDLVQNDALTGLRSRTYCDLELRRIEKSLIRPVSVVASDVNGLKLVNDCLGHDVGDKLLQRLALMLRHVLRATDCVARMGGDEFLILLPGCSRDKAEQILTALRQHIEACNTASSDVPVLVSFGLSHVQTADEPLNKALIDADRLMLSEKAKSRRFAHRTIKNWIEINTGRNVSLEDCRYEI